MDTFSSSERSEIMRKVRDRDSKAEMIVRRLVYSMGYRYRLHKKKLPGCPDLVFGKKRKVIFIHGCFWHRHERCRGNRMPSSRQDYWIPKLEGNKRRDMENQQKLQQMG